MSILGIDLNSDLLNKGNISHVIIAVLSVLLVFYIWHAIKQRKIKLELEEEKLLDEQTRKDFISNINHEIRTPVNVISGMVHLLFQQNLDLQSKQYLEKIQLANSDIKNVIDDALDFNKLFSGDIKVDNEEISFSNFVDVLKEEFILKAKQKSLKINFLIDENIPERIYVDEYLLKSICRKLIDNAIKFTNEGQVDFKIDLVNSTDSVIELGFHISDTGIGMDPDQIKLSARAFKQGDSSKTRNYGGMGTGIFLTVKMLKALDSKLKISSNPQIGTRINFNLVIEYASKELSAEEACKGKKIMLVDDDIINREIGQNLLDKLEVESTVLSSGEEAIEEINNSYDLLIIDVKMPGMDGTEVSEKLNSSGYTIPIIALTSNSDDESLELYKKSGMSGCIPKPIDYDIMKDTIVNILKTKGRDVSFKKIDKASLESTDVKRFSPNQGLRLLNGDKTVYFGILEKFKNNFAEADQKLYQLMEERKLKECEILAHSIKGVSANIGAAPLSNLAKSLEESFKLGRNPDITAFSAELKEVVIEIISYLKDNSKDDVIDESEKQEGDLSKLKEYLTELKDVVSRSDPIRSKEIISELKKFSYSVIIEEKIGKLSEALSSYDFTEVNNIIEEMFKIIEG